MEGRGSGSGALSKKGRIRRLGNLETPITIRILPRKLYLMAKIAGKEAWDTTIPLTRLCDERSNA
jgi:hypothetical protein